MPRPTATTEELLQAANNLLEAATLKTLAQALMRDMEALLARKDVPDSLRKEVEDVRKALKRKWADLEMEAQGATQR